MVDGIFNSKIRYGLQLLGKVRLTALDTVCADLKEIQLIQNKLMRILNGTSLKDKVSTVSLFEKFGFLSVNQMNAQVKLLEIWKATRVEDYPLQVKHQSVPEVGTHTRAATSGKIIEVGKSNLTQKSSISDSIRIWNFAPNTVTEANSLYLAKKCIKNYVKSLPI